VPALHGVLESQQLSMGPGFWWVVVQAVAANAVQTPRPTVLKVEREPAAAA
jgi:hypothetical protein